MADTTDIAPPTFVLFRFPNASNQRNGVGEYVGTLVVPGMPDRAYSIDADVREYTKPDGTRGKFFSGRVLGGQEVMHSMLRGAKFKGQVPPDLVTVMESFPFDDPLPDNLGK